MFVHDNGFTLDTALAFFAVTFVVSFFLFVGFPVAGLATTNTFTPHPNIQISYYVSFYGYVFLIAFITAIFMVAEVICVYDDSPEYAKDANTWSFVLEQRVAAVVVAEMIVGVSAALSGAVWGIIISLSPEIQLISSITVGIGKIIIPIVITFAVWLFVSKRRMNQKRKTPAPA